MTSRPRSRSPGVGDRVSVIAVDFGATSVRVCRVEIGLDGVRLEVVHRASHHPVDDGAGTLRWDWPGLVNELTRGLRSALALGPAASIGIDAWGVDYGLLDHDGRLLEAPVSYRDPRTRGYRRIVDRIGPERLYGISGLQQMPINTIFQVAAHDPDSLAAARHLVMLPELLAQHLTGRVTAELTSAGTTGLLDLATNDWSGELVEAVGLRRDQLPDVQPPGTMVGAWEGTPVVLVGGHDTASAVLGGAAADATFVATGTWLLVGREQAGPDTSPWARAERFTNEQGAAGGIRLLRNVAGWWLVEECRRAWGGADLETLLDKAGAVGPMPAADATDERFLSPDDMPAEIIAATGLPATASRAEIVRAAVESMAASTAAIAERLDRPNVRVFGGGIRSSLFVDVLRRHVPDREVSIGPVEATALGNAMSQSLTLGMFDDVAAARAAFAREGM